MVRLVRHRQTKGPATDRLNLTHRATSRLYSVVRNGDSGTRESEVSAPRSRPTLLPPRPPARRAAQPQRRIAALQGNNRSEGGREHFAVAIHYPVKSMWGSEHVWTNSATPCWGQDTWQI